jgi:hypothetical protein
MLVMKTLFKSSLFIILIVFTVTSCENKDETNSKTLEVKDLTYEGCKEQKNISDSIEEYIEYYTMDSNYLAIRYVNAIFNCCPKEINIEAKIENSKIFYNSFHKVDGCRCYCLYDTYCKIGPLSFSEYTFKINTYGIDEPIELSLDFSPATQGEYTIERKEYNYPAE